MWRDKTQLFVWNQNNRGIEDPLCSADKTGEAVGLADAEAEAISDVGGDDTEPEARESFRVIERYFPADVVSERSRRERYQRGKTAHTIFTWWARRPFAAAAALATTSLIESTGLKPGAQALIDDYCGAESPGLLLPAIEALTQASTQRVLDLFGGGATIPLETGRLGAQTYSLDNNELAHFIQHSLLELAPAHPGLADDVESKGQQFLEDLRRETESFFPARDAGENGRKIAYLWSREVACPGCQGWLALNRRPWVMRRGDEQRFIKRRARPATRDYSVQLCDDGEPDGDNHAWDGQQIACPFCGHRIERDQMQAAMEAKTRDRLMATVTSRGRRAPGRKRFHDAQEPVDLPDAGLLQAAIIRDLNAMDESLPTARLPRWSGVTNPALYGMAPHVELFNLRQRAVLVRCCRLLRDHHRRWVEAMGPSRAAAVAAYMSGLVDQLADWNSRLATWISQNEQVGRGLSGPGLAMVWDHVEIDPLEEAPANLWDKLARICKGLRSLPTFRQPAQVVRGDARQLPFGDRYFDVVVTDPPYFDNLFYSALADCIYVWKRLALKEIFPDHFKAETTDSSRELTMNRHVHDDVAAATEYYRQGMAQVFGEVHRVLKPGGVMSLVFAHSTVEGWASIVDALRQAKMALVAAWPMYVERRHRPRAMGGRAVNTSFVLVARRRRKQVAPMAWSALAASLAEAMAHQDRKLADDEDYGPHTRGRTLFGLAIARYSQQGEIIDESEVAMAAVDVIAAIAQMVEDRVGDEAWGVRRR